MRELLYHTGGYPGMQCRLEGWEDGQMVQVCLDGLDRNQAQAAERVTVQLHTGIEVIIHQKVRDQTECM